MGWLMLFIGLAVPVPIGWWLISRRGADLPLTLLGLASVPMIVWAASIGASIGPCDTPSCVSSSQHDRLAFAIAALVVLLIGLGLLAYHQQLAGGIAIVLGEVLAAIGTQKIDTPLVVAFLVLGVAAIGYLVFVNARAREEARVPDFPPPS